MLYIYIHIFYIHLIIRLYIYIYPSLSCRRSTYRRFLEDVNLVDTWDHTMDESQVVTGWFFEPVSGVTGAFKMWGNNH